MVFSTGVVPIIMYVQLDRGVINSYFKTASCARMLTRRAISITLSNKNIL